MLNKVLQLMLYKIKAYHYGCANSGFPLRRAKKRLVIEVVHNR